MTDLPLHLVSENTTTITFGWTPPPGCVGYYFYANSLRVSNSTNGQQSTVKFKKDPSGKYTVTALGALATGDWPPQTPPPPTSTFPNANGLFGQKAGPAGTDPSYGAAIKAVTSKFVLQSEGYGIPVYFAQASDPIVTARQGLNKPAGYYGVQPTATFRCPPNANSTSGSDHQLVVVQPDGSWVQQYHAVRQTDGSWLCDGLGHAQPNQDLWPRDCCREAKFTLPSGIISLAEIQALKIEHALVGIFPNGWGRDHVGARLRLTGAQPSNLTAVEKMAFDVLSDYGLTVADHGGNDGILGLQCQTPMNNITLTNLLPLLPNLRMVV